VFVKESSNMTHKKKIPLQ